MPRKSRKKKRPDLARTRVEVRSSPAAENNAAIAKPREIPRAISSFGRTYGRVVFDVAFIVVFSIFLLSSNSYQNAEKAANDHFSLWRSTPADSEQVIIVSIGDEDYTELFHAESPLDVVQLDRIVKAILRFRPRVLGVDIDTSTMGFQRLAQPSGIPIVWAEDVSRDLDGNTLAIQKALGGASLPENNYSGHVLFPVDSDGKIRFYERYWEINDEVYPFFAWRVFNQGDKGSAFVADTRPRYVRFASDLTQKSSSYRQVIPAGQLLKLAESGDAHNPLEHRIVLLGGHYVPRGDYQGDTHHTPMGEMFGVDLMAFIVETENLGGGVPPPGPIMLFLLNFFSCLVILFLFHRLDMARALILGTGLSIVLSLALFIYYGNILIFPALISIVILQLIDTVKDLFKQIVFGLIDRSTGKSG